MGDLAGVRRRFHALEEVLDERSRRLLAAAESKVWGAGGISAVARVTGISRPVIRQGLRELSEPAVHPPGRIRGPGGGRKKARLKDPTLVADLEKLIEPVHGHPEVGLRWTCKSARKLAEELKRLGHQVSYPVVAELLHELDYSLRPNRQTKQGASHPDHHAQFEHLHSRVQAHLELRQPVISVDTKKKDWAGASNKRGPKGEPENVRVHDFAIPGTAREAAYGVYDLADDTGWVSVVLDPDTASFAVETIRRWWYAIGQGKYPTAENLLITAASGSNWSRAWLWRAALQTLARETGLVIGVSHVPPGTSKWDKIEHRMFSLISNNWRGQSLASLKVTVDLIAGTTTNNELEVPAESDSAIGIRVPESEIAEARLQRHAFHDEWNYEVLPEYDNSFSNRS